MPNHDLSKWQDEREDALRIDPTPADLAMAEYIETGDAEAWRKATGPREAVEREGIAACMRLNAKQRDRIAALERDLHRTREALRQVQWGSTVFSVVNGEEHHLCLLCDQVETRGHAPDCLVGAAVSAEGER